MAWPCGCTDDGRADVGQLAMSLVASAVQDGYDGDELQQFREESINELCWVHLNELVFFLLGHVAAMIEDLGSCGHESPAEILRRQGQTALELAIRDELT